MIHLKPGHAALEVEPPPFTAFTSLFFPGPSYLVVASLPFLASSLINPLSSRQNVSRYPILQDVILAAHLIRSEGTGGASSWSHRKPGTCTTT